MDLRPGTNFAGFTIRRLLGRGGMGAVYLAGHPRLDRLIALKVLNEVLAADPPARNAFDREAQLAARLEHPNIVGVYDRSHPQDPALWLSMRFIEGGDVTTLLSGTVNGLELPRAVALITDAAHALDYAHAQGVLHRDVKPANLLIDHDLRSGERAVLTDFGIARTMDDTATLTGVAATLAYAAPERFSRKPADHRADIYSLGATLYQLVTGEPPFPRRDQAAVIAAHLLEEPPSVRIRRPELPAGIDEVIATALAKRPEDRYQTCGALAAAIERAAAADRPPTAPQPVETVSTVKAAPAPQDRTVEPMPVGQSTIIGTPPAVGDPMPTESPSPSPAPTTGPAKIGRRKRVAVVLVAVLVVAASALTLSEVLRNRSDSSATPSSATGGAPSIALEKSPRAIAVDPGTHAVFVTNDDHTISALDPVTGQSKTTATLDGTRNTMAIDTASHTIFAGGTNGSDPIVEVIDPDTLASTATIKIGPDKPGAFNFPSGLLADPTTHTVYAYESFDGWLAVIDPAARTQRTDARGSFEFAIDTGTHKLVGINIASHSAYTIDPVSGSAADETAVKDCCSGAVAFDPETRMLYATDTQNSQIIVIDLANRKVAATISTPQLGSIGTSIAIDLAARNLFVSGGIDKSIVVIDLTQNAVSRSIDVADTPTAMAVDSSTHTLYSISAAQTLTILHP